MKLETLAQTWHAMAVAVATDTIIFIKQFDTHMMSRQGGLETGNE